MPASGGSFKPGYKPGPGRPKGSLQKRTYQFFEAIQELGFDPPTELVNIYREAKKTYDNYAVIYDNISKASEASGNPFPVEDKADKYLKIALDAVKEIASYAYPKLKAIDKTALNPLEGMTAEEKIEYLKQAVKLLEQQNEPRPVSHSSNETNEDPKV
jgi:hypothetical protein